MSDLRASLAGAYAYYNGQILPYSKIKIPLTDRSIYFGDGVYDVMIGKNGKLHQRHEHLKRLRRNAEALMLNIELEDEELVRIFDELIELTGFDEYIAYIQVTRYSDLRRHACPDFYKSNLLLTVTRYKYQRSHTPISLTVRDDIRYRMCNIKTLNLLPAVLSATDAEVRGFDECVFLRDGIVTECAHSNISIIKDGCLITHPSDRDILPGITRATLIDICKELKVPVIERKFTLSELVSSDEILVSSTTNFLRRAGMLDGETVGMKNSPLAERLTDALVGEY